VNHCFSGVAMDKIFNMNIKNIAITGILLSCVYFFVVIVFVATSSTNWLMLFDIVTMIAGIYYVLLIVALPFSEDGKKIPAIIFAAALMIITNIAHTINLTSIQNIKTE
jgi:hypothetical protein